MKVAIVHDYLNQAGGAERVVAVLHRMFPKAPIFTTLFDPKAVGTPLADADVRVSWMHRLPNWKRQLPQLHAALSLRRPLVRPAAGTTS